MSGNHVSDLFGWSLPGATLPAGLHCGTARADTVADRFDTSSPLKLPAGPLVTPAAATGAVFSRLDPGLAAHQNCIPAGAIKTAVGAEECAAGDEQRLQPARQRRGNGG